MRPDALDIGCCFQSYALQKLFVSWILTASEHEILPHEYAELVLRARRRQLIV